MNARVEPKYGHYTLEALRTLKDWPEATRTAILDALEAASPQEVVQRLRRIETKLHKISGVPDSTTMTLELSDGGDILIHVSGYDVTLAQIKHLAEQYRTEYGRTLFILKDQALLATVRLTGRA